MTTTLFMFLYLEVVVAFTKKQTFLVCSAFNSYPYASPLRLAMAVSILKGMSRDCQKGEEMAFLYLFGRGGQGWWDIQIDSQIIILFFFFFQHREEQQLLQYLSFLLEQEIKALELNKANPFEMRVNSSVIYCLVTLIVNMLSFEYKVIVFVSKNKISVICKAQWVCTKEQSRFMAFWASWRIFASVMEL